MSRTNDIGFPQGGVCSAKFWDIAFNQAVNIINPPGGEILGVAFADDCAVACGGSNFNYIVQTLQITLDLLTAWGVESGLTFNAAKTKVVPFTRSRLVPPCPLTLDRVPVPYSTEARYLGLTLDSKLFWTQHIHRKTANGKRLLLALLNAVSQNWGPSPRLSRWIYSGIVRPMITYCSVVWYHEAAANRDGLAQLVQLALLSIT